MSKVSHSQKVQKVKKRSSKRMFHLDTNVCPTLKDSNLYLSLTHCAFIMNFMANSYFILQIYHAKSFKMRHITYLYFSYLSRYS